MEKSSNRLSLKPMLQPIPNVAAKLPNEGRTDTKTGGFGFTNGKPNVHLNLGGVVSFI